MAQVGTTALRFLAEAAAANTGANATEPVEDDENETRDLVLNILSKALLFVLVFGLAGSVEFKRFKSKFTNARGIFTGVLCQFVLLPLLGFITVVAFELPPEIAIMILVTCSSPGGSYSNWYCSLFNVDLALSVAMTTVSNVLAVGMLPLNIFLYVTTFYPKISSEDDDGVNPELDWGELGLTLALVLLGITLGVGSGYKWPHRVNLFNRIGNLCGLMLVIVGLFASSESEKPWFRYEPTEIIAVWIPPSCAILLSMMIAYLFGLDMPERVAVAIEASYQNTGLALAVALSLDQEKTGLNPGIAAGVPSIYQFVMLPGLISLGLVSWWRGWSYAPKGTPLRVALIKNYQPALDGDDEVDENGIFADDMVVPVTDGDGIGDVGKVADDMVVSITDGDGTGDFGKVDDPDSEPSFVKGAATKRNRGDSL